jgi:hypothetical protein
MSRILLAILLLVGCSPEREAGPAPIPGGQVRWRPDPLAGADRVPVATAPFVATPPAIDGDLTDPIWSEAQWQGAAPAFAARCDQANLYLAVRAACAGPDRQASGPGEVRDRAIEAGDLMGFRLAPQDHQEMFVDLVVAPDATVADRQMTWTPDGVGRYYGGFTLGGLRTGSRVVQGVWTVEVAIPWSALWTAPPRPGQGASLRLQVAGRAAGATVWTTWAPSAGRLDEPPSRFGLLVFGAEAAPWRVVQGELVAGPAGRVLALALVRTAASSEQAEIVVSGMLAGQAPVRLDSCEGRVVMPVALAGQVQRADGFRIFTAQVRVGGRSWPLGGWMLRDPLVAEAGALVVPGVGGEAAGLPQAASGLSLEAQAIPAGRTAVNLRLRPLAGGIGPWRLRVDLGARPSGPLAGDAPDLADLVIPALPAVAAIPTAGLPSGSHRLTATLTNAAGVVVVAAVLPLEIVP